MRPRILRSVPVVPPRKREGMSAKHEEDIRSMPCLACGKPPRGDPHHLQRSVPKSERGTSRRASDQYLIPLCRACHTAAEGGGDDEAWLAERGIDGRAMAAVMWTNRGDRPAIFRVVWRDLMRRGIYA